MDQSLSLCEQYYEASLVLLDMVSNELPLAEYQVRAFMRSQPYREWLFSEIIRIAIQQDYFPESEQELSALNRYANVMADIMLRAISQSYYTQNNYAIELRQN